MEKMCRSEPSRVWQATRRRFLRRATATLALGVSLLACTTQPPPPSLAITHVTLIDGTGAPPRGDVTVVVQGNRIAALGPSASTSWPKGARVLDGRGMFLIPGLWDMHVHAFGYSFPDFVAPLMVANGVTGVRDMGWYVDSAARWKREVAAGRLLGPRLVVSGRIDGPANRTPWVAGVGTAAEARHAVDTLVGAGADFIKVYSRLPREAYFAAAAESRRLGVPFAGHVPFSVTIAEAARAGQASVEHEDDMMRACSRRDAELRADLLDPTRLGGRSEAEVVRAQAAAMRSSDDSAWCAALFALLAREGTRVVPTLVVYQPYAHAFDSAGTHAERLRYAPKALRDEWRQRTPIAVFEPRDTAVVGAYFSLPRTGEMRRAGVRLMVGTDTPLPYVYPGFSVHDELALLVRAGLTPAEALDAATREPAAYLGALDSLGTVERGKVADLVLLEADPLADIANTRRVAAVVVNGRLVDRAGRERLLREVEGRAGVGARGR